ncbi:MAG: GNAT family N-acetyltransferase [Myxococcales bacterium]|nr:GNAT family N-acetyltransferase [Myxococcales bacterium]
MRAPVRIDVMNPGDLTAVAAMASARADVEQLQAELSRPWSRAWVAREGADDWQADRDAPPDDPLAGEVVAFLLAWHVTDELHVLDLATREDRRRRGIARALLEAAVRYAREHGVRHVLLEARRSNQGALALYEQVGFIAARIRARYYPDDEDAVEMLLVVDN